jgi:hypothetical protein
MGLETFVFGQFLSNVVEVFKPVSLALIAFVTFKWLYRLYFHPLAKFPGPRLAAITHLYEGYYDVVHKGAYIFEVGKMHEKYSKCWLWQDARVLFTNQYKSLPLLG